MSRIIKVGDIVHITTRTYPVLKNREAKVVNIRSNEVAVITTKPWRGKLIGIAFRGREIAECIR